MGTLWLYAISVDDVRDFFAAPDSVASELLDAASAVATEQAKPALIGKVGPLTRHQITPVVEWPGPTMDDAREMIEGRALPPHRLGPAWVIVRRWCAMRCRDSAEVTVDRQQLANLDFAHVACGLSSQFSFGTVLARDPHLPLLPAPGLVVGWMPNSHVRRMAAQWPAATASDRDGTAPSGTSETFSRDDHTGVALKWPLDGALNGFFVRAATWAGDDGDGRGGPADVLAMFQ